MFQDQNRETIFIVLEKLPCPSRTLWQRAWRRPWRRPCFTTQHQTCKTKTTVCKTNTKTDFLVSDRSCPKTSDHITGVSSSHCVDYSNLKLLCKCQRRSLLNVPFVLGFILLKTDIAQQFQVVQKVAQNN